MTPTSKEAIRYARKRGYIVLDDGTLIGPKGVMRPTPTSVGYPSFKVGPHGRQRTILLHVYAAYCWYGEVALEAECVRHKDDVRTNCTRENILIGSRSDNQMDIPKRTRLRVGRNAVGTRHARTSTARKKRDVRIVACAAAGETHRSIAQSEGLSRAHVSRLVRAASKLTVLR